MGCGAGKYVAEIAYPSRASTHPTALDHFVLGESVVSMASSGYM
jgi:hypothetical protein